jgi:hypothetical protein
VSVELGRVKLGRVTIQVLGRKPIGLAHRDTERHQGRSDDHQTTKSNHVHEIHPHYFILGKAAGDWLRF